MLSFLFAPRRSPPDREMESQAKPAAFDAAGGSVFLPIDSLDLEGLFPSLVGGRKVVRRRFRRSGLGVREGSLGGLGSCGEL